MAYVKWIKIVTDIFDDEKMLLIESLPSADSIIVIWFKLLCLAGKNNNNGVFIMSDKIPYTDEMLSTIFRRDVNTVRLALKTFEAYGMIEIIDGVITIPNWCKHQTLDSYEKKKERDRIYQNERRKKQREIAEKSSDTSFDKSSDVAISDKDIEEDIDREVEEDKEGEKDIVVVSNDTTCHTQSVRRIMNKWNELSTYGVKSVDRITTSSQRYGMLIARLKEYGEDKVISAIEYIKTSDFLQGKNNRGWSITFDWFVKPNNFPKVLEGNYDNRKGGRTYQNKTVDMLQDSYDMMSEWVRKKEMEENGDDN